jgi:putative ABC transport system substrate-binding protein
VKRRAFITLIGGAAAAWPLAPRAQQAAQRPRLGILIYSTPERDPSTQSFLRGLRDLGYIDGQNIDIEYRFAEGKPERLRDLAAELVRTKPDVIFALGGDVTPFVAGATQTIPIVYVMSADPVQLAVADSLGKPGGNATGVTFLSDELAAKRLEVLKEAVPASLAWDFFGIPTMPIMSCPLLGVRQWPSAYNFIPWKCVAPAISIKPSPLPRRRALMRSTRYHRGIWWRASHASSTSR